MLRGLGIALLVLLAGAVFLWRSLLPPAPLAVPDRGAVLERVTLVQPGEGRRADRRVVIEGARIDEIGPATGTDELAGAFALPGLIDMHVHFPPDSGLRQSEIHTFLFLLHGVTSVRDAGDADGTSSRTPREGVREGRFPGPRSFACGPLVDGPRTRWPNSRVVADAAEAETVVAEIAEAGWDCVKVYDDLTPETLDAIQAAARRRGLPVIGHVPRRVEFEAARLDDVQHLTGVPNPAGNLEPFPEVLATWRRFGAERAARIEAASLRDGVAHTPTLVTLERAFAFRDYEALRTSDEAALLPRFYADVVWSPVEGMPFLRTRDERQYRLLEDAFRAGARFVGRLHRAGVAIHAGTDTQIAFLIPGAALHREVRILADAAGLGAEAALAAATTVPGRSLPLEGLGRLAEGAPADLALFERDPTRDLDALETLVAVVADGRLYRRAELDAQLARYRDYYGGAVFDTVSKFVARRMLASVFADFEAGSGEP